MHSKISSKAFRTGFQLGSGKNLSLGYYSYLIVMSSKTKNDRLLGRINYPYFFSNAFIKSTRASTASRGTALYSEARHPPTDR